MTMGLGKRIQKWQGGKPSSNCKKPYLEKLPVEFQIDHGFLRLSRCTTSPYRIAAGITISGDNEKASVAATVAT
jgi:hypothetical protein